MLFHPTYFSTIQQFSKMINGGAIYFEEHDNFQKQTYRNRCYIYGANGKQLLNIPVKKESGVKQLYKDVKIDYDSNWQAAHLKSLISAYKSSPFFEFYIDDITPIFKKKKTFLMDLNIKTFKVVLNALELENDFYKTTEFEKNVKNDFRSLVNAKSKKEVNLPRYTQVFDDKHGFISNLSILDLLFMEGPAALIYLSKI